MLLYDFIKKKQIKIDLFDLNIKKKIINQKLRPLNKNEKKENFKKYIDDFKLKLSNDDNVIPLYDINNNDIFFIHKNDVYYLIKEYKFRPLNKNLIKFIKDNNLNDKNIINLIELFDFEVLEKILLKFIFYNTKDIGEDITYLLNPAYIKFLDINPYLKKSSIINISLNVGIIKTNQIKDYGNKIELLYNKIKSYLFSKDEILSHIKHIQKEDAIKLIRFYTFYGAFFLNNYLRNNNELYKDNNITSQIIKLNNVIRSSPKLNTNKIIFRFVKDDIFLNDIDIGDIYTEESFMSCTRKPNINSINEDFGFILLKINLPANFTGCCLCIESDSVFPNEKEIILTPGSKLLLKSVDKNVDFFVFDNKNQRNIKKKYEFDFIGFNDLKIPNYSVIDIPSIDFTKNILEGFSLEEKIDFFWENYGRLTRNFYLLLPDNTKKLFYCNYYNSNDVYSKFFQYKIPDGLYIYSYNDKQELDIFIELGDILIVNFPSQFIPISNSKNTELYVSLISYGFKISKVSLYPEYKQFDKGTFTSRIYINSLLYELVINSNIGIINNKYEIEEFLNSEIKQNNINYNLQKYLPVKSYKDLIKNVIQKNIFDYKYVVISLPKTITNLFTNFNPYNLLLNKKIIYNIPTSDSKYVNRRVTKSPEFKIIETNNFRNVIN